MKLLFDEHLSPTLVRRLGDLFPGSTHVQALSLRGERDRRLWNVAAELGLTIVTRDSDFEHLAMALGPPPKVVILRTREGKTDAIERLIRSHSNALRAFTAVAEAHLLIIEP